MADEALNAGAVYSEMILRMEKFDAAMKTISGALHKIDEEVERTKKRFDFSAVGAKMEKVGRSMSLAVTLPLSIIGGVAVKNASDLNETLSKTEVIFGENTAEITKWGDTAATTMGMSKRSALDAASSFALFAKQSGKTGKAVNDFSKEAVKGSADLASFFNTSPEEAMTAWQAALRGESEPIRRYNVLLDDASLRQEAFSQGIIKSTKEALTPQQRILAAQALIMKQTSAAQGDFARTSTGLANQSRILKAEYEDASGKLGQLLLPAMLQVVSIANAALEKFNALPEGVKKVVVVLGVLAAATGPVLIGAGKVLQILPALKAGFVSLNAIMAANPVGLIVVGIGALIAVTVACITHWNKWGAVVMMLLGPMGLIISTVKTIYDHWKNITKAFESKGMINGILAIGKALVDVVVYPLQQILELASHLPTRVGKYAKEGAEAIKKMRTEHLGAGDDAEKSGNKQVKAAKKTAEEIKAARAAASEEWKRKQAELEEYMRKSGQDELGLEKIRWKDRVDMWAKAYRDGLISQKQYNAVYEMEEREHLQKVAEINTNNAEKIRNMWSTSLDLTSSDVAAKVVTIGDALKNGLISSAQAAAMTMASVISSAVSAIGGLMNSMYSAQMQSIRDQYDATTAAEKAYMDYQDAEDAKSYANMNAREKREYNLKKEADKSRLRAEEEKNAKLAKIQKKQNRANLVSSIAQIGISTAMGIMNVWAHWAAYPPVAAALSAAVGVIGAVETAAAYVAAAPGLATGGIVRKKSGGTQITAGEGGADEYVVPSTELVMRGIANKIAALLPKEIAKSGNTASGGSGANGGIDMYELIPVDVKVHEEVACNILFGWSKNGKLLTDKRSVVAV